jgi:hypothetical protein
MKVPFVAGHRKLPASPFAARGADVQDLGLDDAALDVGHHHLLGSEDELRDRGYLGPRHAIRGHAS